MKIKVKTAPNIVWLWVLLPFTKFFRNEVRFKNHKTPIRGTINHITNIIIHATFLFFTYHTIFSLEYIFLLQTTKFTKTAKENNRGKELFFTLRIIAGKYLKRVNNNITSNKMNAASTTKPIPVSALIVLCC